jgi:hypothetical protein
MKQEMTSKRRVFASVKKLAQTEVESPETTEVVQDLAKAVQALVEALGSEESEEAQEGAPEAQEGAPEGVQSQAASVHEQIDRMHAAASGPAKNYQRVVSVLGGLKRAALAAERPENASSRPKIVEITKRVAGLFAEVDTIQDLDKPLEAIEKAVHSLYGEQSKNSTYFFERRGKGHHSE